MMTYQSIREALGVPKIKELRSIWDFHILLKDQTIFFLKKKLIIFCILFYFEKKKLRKKLIYYNVFHELHVFISKYN